VVDDRHLQPLFRPLERLGIATLACEEERAEPRKVVAGDVLAVRILLPNGAKGRRGREQGADAVLLDHAPEGTGVGRPHRLPLVEDGRAAVEQGRVHGVRVPDGPADVRRGPIDLAGVDVVDVLHRPRERDRVAAVVAHDAFRLTRRS
jgi:hypothetical protein